MFQARSGRRSGGACFSVEYDMPICLRSVRRLIAARCVSSQAAVRTRIARKCGGPVATFRSHKGSASRSIRARRPAVLANMRALRRLRPAFKSHVRPAASGRSASVDTGALQVSTCVHLAGEARAVHGRRRRTWSCSTLVRQPAAAPWRKAASRACSSQASPLGWGLYSKRRPFSTVLSIACVCTENHTPNRRRTRHRTWTKRPRSAA